MEIQDFNLNEELFKSHIVEALEAGLENESEITKFVRDACGDSPSGRWVRQVRSDWMRGALGLEAAPVAVDASESTKSLGRDFKSAAGRVAKLGVPVTFEMYQANLLVGTREKGAMKAVVADKILAKGAKIYGETGMTELLDAAIADFAWIAANLDRLVELNPQAAGNELSIELNLLFLLVTRYDVDVILKQIRSLYDDLYSDAYRGLRSWDTTDVNSDALDSMIRGPLSASGMVGSKVGWDEDDRTFGSFWKHFVGNITNYSGHRIDSPDFYKFPTRANGEPAGSESIRSLERTAHWALKVCGVNRDGLSANAAMDILSGFLTPTFRAGNTRTENPAEVQINALTSVAFPNLEGSLKDVAAAWAKTAIKDTKNGNVVELKRFMTAAGKFNPQLRVLTGEGPLRSLVQMAVSPNLIMDTLRFSLFPSTYMIDSIDHQALESGSDDGFSSSIRDNMTDESGMWNTGASNAMLVGTETLKKGTVSDSLGRLNDLANGDEDAVAPVREGFAAQISELSSIPQVGKEQLAIYAWAMKQDRVINIVVKDLLAGVSEKDTLATVIDAMGEATKVSNRRSGRRWAQKITDAARIEVITYIGL